MGICLFCNEKSITGEGLCTFCKFYRYILPRVKKTNKNDKSDKKRFSFFLSYY